MWLMRLSTSFWVRDWEVGADGDAGTTWDCRTLMRRGSGSGDG